MHKTGEDCHNMPHPVESVTG